MKPQYRKVRVTIFHKAKGYDSSLKLDTRHFDDIGFTRESLDDYMQRVILFNKPDLWYFVDKDVIKEY